jgi:hypothetical protein
MQRKQRPFYYASEEQFRWLQVIASKVDPEANLADVEALKEIAETVEQMMKGGSVDGDKLDRTATVSPGEAEEGMEGVVDGIGTLMMDSRGRASIPFSVCLLTRICRRIRVTDISSQSARLRAVFYSWQDRPGRTLRPSKRR